MAQVHVAFSSALGGYPVPAKAPLLSEVITSSATSQSSSAATRGGDVAIVTVSGGNVWVQIGTNPTAASGADWLVLDGQTREFGPIAEGEKIAVIDA